MMKSTAQIFFTVGLIFSGAILLLSCNKALHNEGRTVFVDQRIEIRTTSSDTEVWQTDHMAIKYQLEDFDDHFIISGKIHIKDRITLSYPVVDFLKVYVNLLDQDGVAAGKHNISPSVSRYNTVPGSMKFNKKVLRDEDTTSFAFSYWGNFRERGITHRRNAVDWEIYHAPFVKE